MHGSRSTTMFSAIITLLFLSVNGQEDLNKSSNGHDIGEVFSEIYSDNATQPRAIKFEDNFNSNHVSFDDQNSGLPRATKFQFESEPNQPNPSIDSQDDGGPTHVKFDDFGQDIASGLNKPVRYLKPNNGKKKRRRRKPRQQLPGQPGFWNPGRPLPNGPLPGQNYSPAPGFNQNFGPNSYRPDFNGQFYRPPRRPRPSLASDALSAVTGALTSIAHNDDYQCVARLLCEAAAGGALGGSSLLESISGLQPLLTLLSAYNGISSNPLFLFGRAAFLGMSSKSNPGSCRYAYPLCPTDPEQLVHYLNNHNGGFFRFFNAPQQGPQNLEQFYNQLSQNYGQYQPNQGNNQEFYGLLNPGSYQNPAGPPNLYPNGYGNQQGYGFAYPHNQNNNGDRIRFKNGQELNDVSEVDADSDQNKISRRIQNNPLKLNDNSVTSNTKWLFPNEDDVLDDVDVGVQYVNHDYGFTDNRNGKTFKFPDTDANYNNDNAKDYYNKPINNYIYAAETVRTPKGISFPETKRNFNDYTNNLYNAMYSIINNVSNGIKNKFKGVNYNQNIHTTTNYQDEPGVTTVYVVRGNGDPNKPEIVKLRPGETL